VATFHCEMFRFHDELDWARFQRSVANCLVEQGYEKTRAKNAAGFTMKAYKEADNAVIAQEANDERAEAIAYANSLENFIKAHKALGIETKSPKYKIGWYRASRHKQLPRIIWNLFMENVSKLGWRKLLLAIQLTHISIARVYPAHNAHDWPRVRKAMKEYWLAVMRYCGAPLPVEL